MNHYLGARGVDCLRVGHGRVHRAAARGEALAHHHAGDPPQRRPGCKLFHDKLEVRYTGDVDRLIQVGRETLRRNFFEADIGVSRGERFAIAETGTLLLVENGATAACRPRCRRCNRGHRYREGGREPARRDPAAVAADALGHRPADHDLRQHDLRPAQARRASTARRSPSGAARQRPQPGLRGRRTAPDAQLHPLRCVHEPLPGVYADRRSRLRHGVSRADRQVTPHMLGLETTRDLPTASSCGACGGGLPVNPHPFLAAAACEEAVRATAEPHHMRGQGAKHSKETLVWKAWRAQHLARSVPRGDVRRHPPARTDASRHQAVDPLPQRAESRPPAACELARASGRAMNDARAQPP